jgi:hypothetical protein
VAQRVIFRQKVRLRLTKGLAFGVQQGKNLPEIHQAKLQLNQGENLP